MADPGFPRGGANPRGWDANYLTNFSRKLHENEEILARGSGHASLATPRSANEVSVNNLPRVRDLLTLNLAGKYRHFLAWWK